MMAPMLLIGAIAWAMGTVALGAIAFFVYSAFPHPGDWSHERNKMIATCLLWPVMIPWNLIRR